MKKVRLQDSYDKILENHSYDSKAKQPCWTDLIGIDRESIQYFQIRFLSIDLDRKSIWMNTYFYRKYPTRPTKIQSILIKLTFHQNFYGFLSNFPGTILCQKSN